MTESLRVGQVVDLGGQRMRYLGDGKFEPELAPINDGEPLAKRFSTEESRPLGGRWSA